MEHLKPGELLVVGNKVYAVCPVCKHLIRINKPLLGDLHICEGGP